MDWIDFWRLCDEFTIVQAALLIAGHDPSHYENSVEAMAPENRPFGYQAVRAALNNSVVAGRLKAKIVNAQEILTQHDPDGEWLYDRAVDLNYPDVGKTVIPAEDMKTSLPCLASSFPLKISVTTSKMCWPFIFKNLTKRSITS